MKYLAIRYYSGGFHAIIDHNGNDTDTLRVANMETYEQARRLYYFLQKNGYKCDDELTIHVLAFGVCRLELMVEMPTLPRYICFDGGMLNPNLLFADKKTMMIPEREGSDRPEVIVEMVREFFLGKKRTIHPAKPTIIPKTVHLPKHKSTGTDNAIPKIEGNGHNPDKKACP